MDRATIEAEITRLTEAEQHTKADFDAQLAALDTQRQQLVVNGNHALGQYAGAKAVYQKLLAEIESPEFVTEPPDETPLE